MKQFAGICVVWQQNGTYNYERMARYAAQQASDLLGLPHVLIEGKSDNLENTRLYIGEDKRSIFLNNMQLEAMEQSPFDYTLFIDADYLVLSKSLLEELERFIASVAEDGPDLVMMGSKNIVNFSPSPAINALDLWSTVCMYTAGSATLTRAKEIRDRWRFNGQPALGKLYRNDYAIGMAAIQSGRPLNLLQLSSGYKSEIRVDFAIKDLKAEGVDVHAMNKARLMEEIERG